MALPYTPEGLGVKRSARATRTMAGQLAHQTDALGSTAAYSVHAVRSPDAAGSMYANSPAGSTFSPNECRTAGSN